MIHVDDGVFRGQYEIDWVVFDADLSLNIGDLLFGAIKMNQTHV